MKLEVIFALNHQKKLFKSCSALANAHIYYLLNLKSLKICEKKFSTFKSIIVKSFLNLK